MKRKLKWRWDAGIEEWYSNNTGTDFGIRFLKGCGWEAFVLSLDKDHWNKLHMDFTKSSREAMDICERHWLWMQKENNA